MIKENTQHSRTGREYFLNLIRASVKKPHVMSLVVKDWRSLPKIGSEMRTPFAPLQFVIVLQILARTVYRRSKRHPSWKRRN